MRKYISIAASLLIACMAMLPRHMQAQGAIVNEISNGPAGTQEYLELVVVGPTGNLNCGPVDLRGFLVDDNNGDFSCGACAGTGIATGHIRFANIGNWAAVPTGSIIVIYDPAVKNPKVPADDHDDTAPADGVYILSSSDAFLEASTSPCASNTPTGLGACGTCTGVATYTGACYTAGVANTNWGLRNSGDAGQVRRPNGTYFHGIGFGTVASLISGGPDGLFMAGDGTGKCYSFMNTGSDDFRAVANYAAGTAVALNETPGAANGTNNGNWILALKAACPLPINYYRELTVKPENGMNTLQWATATEVNADRWDIMRATSLEEGFRKIGTVPCAGNSNQLLSYSFPDANPQEPKLWYQLKQYDRNGHMTPSNMVQVVNESVPGTFLDVWPNPSTGIFHVRGAIANVQSLQIVDLMGRVLDDVALDQFSDYFELDLDLHDLAEGNYLLQIRSGHGPLLRRISVTAAR